MAEASSLTAHTAVPVNVPAPPPELERQPLVANLRSFGWISNRVA